MPLLRRFSVAAYNKNSASANTLRNQVLVSETASVGVVYDDTSIGLTNIANGAMGAGKHLLFVHGNSRVDSVNENRFATLRTERNKVLVVNSSPLKTTYTNKHTFFNMMHTSVDCNPLIPLYWTGKQDAVNYLSQRDGNSVVERHTLNGSGGDGIRIVNNPVNLSDDARLYVQYIKKKEEYRVHFFKLPNGTIQYHTQKKMLRRDRAPTTDATIPFNGAQFKVRNLANGWIYATNNIVPPAIVRDAAAAVAAELSLTYGALDIIYNAGSDSAYVLEVNTAPGLVGNTVQWLVSQLRIVADTEELFTGRHSIYERYLPENPAQNIQEDDADEDYYPDDTFLDEEPNF